MKSKVKIIEEVDYKENLVIIEFLGDPKKQHFEIKCLFDTKEIDIQKWDIWEMVWKLEADIFTEPKTGKKSYFTYLICTKANFINGIRMKEKGHLLNR